MYMTFWLTDVAHNRSDGESSGDQVPAESSDPRATASAPSAPSQESTDAAAVGIATVVGVLPGLGNYTDSDQSDTSSSDSDIDTDLFRRDVQPKPGHDSATTASTAKHRHR